MCDVPSIAVFCSESIECFPGTASKHFLKLLLIIPVAPIITGIIVHFRFHIRCISIHNLLYFNFFSASFCTTFQAAGIATSISYCCCCCRFVVVVVGTETAQSVERDRATGCTTCGSRFEYRLGHEISSLFQNVWTGTGAHPASFQQVPEFFPGDKAAGVNEDS